MIWARPDSNWGLQLPKLEYWTKLYYEPLLKDYRIRIFKSENYSGKGGGEAPEGRPKMSPNPSLPVGRNCIITKIPTIIAITKATKIITINVLFIQSPMRLLEAV
jgi:hypothetical protein